MAKTETQKKTEVGCSVFDRRDRSISQGNLLSCGPYLANYRSKYRAETSNSKINKNPDRSHLIGF